MAPDPRYVAARRVLLDALHGLRNQLDAVVLVGAQAVYLRTGEDTLPVAPFTLDGDLVLDPELLGAEPALEEAMVGAGLQLKRIDGHVEPGIWVASAMVGEQDVEIPVDLIVPDGVLPSGGRRGARLGPVHGRRAARRIPGLEAALVDRAPEEVRALDPVDARAHRVQVAGVAALLIAKAHKLGERSAGNRPDRLKDKDALDVVRLMLASEPVEVAATLAALAEDERAGASTATGLRYLDGLFGRAGGSGIELATRALRAAMSAERVAAICRGYMGELRAVR